MRLILIVIFTIFSVCLFTEERHNIYVITNGTEYDLQGNEIFSFTSEYNSDGLLKTFKQYYSKAEKKNYTSEYSYDDKYRMIKTIHYQDGEKYLENIIEYNDLENKVILRSIGDGNILTENYVYNGEKLSNIILQYNSEPPRDLRLDITNDNNDIIINYYEKNSLVETYKAKFSNTNIIEIINNNKEIKFSYAGNKLIERVTDQSIIKFESKLIESVKNENYSFLKDFFNIRKLNKNVW